MPPTTPSPRPQVGEQVESTVGLDKGQIYIVRSVDGNVLELEYHTGRFARFAHVSSVIVCPPPAAQTAASLPAPAAGQGEGFTAQLNRHHLARCASYLRSNALIRSSLIAAAAAISSTAQAADENVSSVEMVSCMAVPHEFWVDFASKVSLSLFGLVLPAVLLALFLWFGVIAPWVHIRVNAVIARSDKALDAVIDARMRSRS